jgi:hypothetical protein
MRGKNTGYGRADALGGAGDQDDGSFHRWHWRRNLTQNAKLIFHGLGLIPSPSGRDDQQIND